MRAVGIGTCHTGAHQKIDCEREGITAKRAEKHFPQGAKELAYD